MGVLEGRPRKSFASGSMFTVNETIAQERVRTRKRVTDHGNRRSEKLLRNQLPSYRAPGRGEYSSLRPPNIGPLIQKCTSTLSERLVILCTRRSIDWRVWDLRLGTQDSAYSYQLPIVTEVNQQTGGASDPHTRLACRSIDQSGSETSSSVSSTSSALQGPTRAVRPPALL